MNETEKDIRSDIEPKSPLPWTSCFGDIVGADKIPVVLEISAKNADYITHACNAYPKLVAMLKTISTGGYVIARERDYTQTILPVSQIKALLIELGELPIE
jgi:hypothetical protein